MLTAPTCPLDRWVIQPATIRCPTGRRRRPGRRRRRAELPGPWPRPGGGTDDRLAARDDRRPAVGGSHQWDVLVRGARLAAGSALGGHPSFSSFEPPVGTAYLHQQIGDHGPRIHLDVEADDLETTAARLTAIGAGRGRARRRLAADEKPGRASVLPGRDRPRVVAPAASATRDGHRLRLVQGLDVPEDHLDREVSFWRSATGWRWEPSPAPSSPGSSSVTTGPRCSCSSSASTSPKGSDPRSHRSRHRDIEPRSTAWSRPGRRGDPRDEAGWC